MMHYLFELECPRCGRLDQQVVEKYDEAPRLNCGNCLMEERLIVELKITSVVVQEDGER
jgi:transcription elongation factor Elf1